MMTYDSIYTIGLCRPVSTGAILCKNSWTKNTSETVGFRVSITGLYFISKVQISQFSIAELNC